MAEKRFTIMLVNLAKNSPLFERKGVLFPESIKSGQAQSSETHWLNQVIGIPTLKNPFIQVAEMSSFVPKGFSIKAFIDDDNKSNSPIRPLMTFWFLEDEHGDEPIMRAHYLQIPQEDGTFKVQSLWWVNEDGKQIVFDEDREDFLQKASQLIIENLDMLPTQEEKKRPKKFTAHFGHFFKDAPLLKAEGTYVPEVITRGLALDDDAKWLNQVLLVPFAVSAKDFKATFCYVELSAVVELTAAPAEDAQGVSVFSVSFHDGPSVQVFMRLADIKDCSLDEWPFKPEWWTKSQDGSAFVGSQAEKAILSTCVEMLVAGVSRQ